MDALGEVMGECRRFAGTGDGKDTGVAGAVTSGGLLFGSEWSG